MVARDVPFPVLAERLKELYVETSARHFRLGAKRMTDSRISLLTGLQRKDIRAVRARLAVDDAPETQSAGQLPRVVAQWMGAGTFTEKSGKPRRLPRTAEEGPSFDSLVAEVSRDVHPRTVLDELVRLGLVEHDEDDCVRLVTSGFVPRRGETELLGYFGANLGDHVEAAVSNLLASPEPGPFFERSVHYNQLTSEALEELDVLARRLQQDALSELSARALVLQQRDDGREATTGRFRCGTYIYHEMNTDEVETE
jgi:hypothetical protein